MNLNDPRHPWARLTAAARTVQDDRDTAAPYGFATRVAALGLAQEHKAASLIDAFALRALGIAALVALGSVALNYNDLLGSATTNLVADATVPAANDEIILPTTDAVAVVLDIAD